eukprot:CAMPEP_0170497734 /NCGR_PEP_ID=MMETSP0208-20121228/25617_1 /TAXON_ID=197538 /ORGANISM="Strombidium inclinatum, Strain S3" /LENGTH=340 /DNA_ID=CAMNT_0010774647 /DNA_START=249 /DNA_END=1268 /DNA_ORIENTATION=+
MNTFLNEVLIFSLLKRKEFSNARSLTKECLDKLEKKDMFGFSSSSEPPFPLLFFKTLSLNGETSSKTKQQALIELFGLQRDLKKKLGNSSPVPEAFESKHLALIRYEQHSLFGIFPPREDYKSQYMMVVFEIFRVLSRHQDFRNAYKVLTDLNSAIPSNPYIISRLGRFCLETGRRAEALNRFKEIETMIKKVNQKEKAADGEGGFQMMVGARERRGTEVLDSLLNLSEDQQNLSEESEELMVMNLINKGLVHVFDGKFELAIEVFRQIQTFRPANIIAANNLATCKIFLNKTGEAISLFEDLIKKDPLKNINEQLVANLVAMYDIHYACDSADKKRSLA